MWWGQNFCHPTVQWSPTYKHSGYCTFSLVDCLCIISPHFPFSFQLHDITLALHDYTPHHSQRRSWILRGTWWFPGAKAEQSHEIGALSAAIQEVRGLGHPRQSLSQLICMDTIYFFHWHFSFIIVYTNELIAVACWCLLHYMLLYWLRSHIDLPFYLFSDLLFHAPWCEADSTD